MATTEHSVELTIVVPMLDAGPRVAALHDELSALLVDRFPQGELVLVDDGSTDDTWQRLERLSRTDPRVVGVRLGRNVGQTGALCAGFSVARGPVVVMMDDDLECDADDVHRFVDAVRAGADFASGWRQGWRVPMRSIGSQLYNRRLRSWGLPFHDAGCGFNAMTLDLAQRIAALGWGVRQHRFKPAVATLTDRIVEVPFEVRPTTESHHGLRSLAVSWLDVEARFGPVPTGVLGAITVGLPTLAAAIVLAPLRSAPRGPARVARMVSGATMAGMALAGADVWRRWWQMERRDASTAPFVIAERTGGVGEGPDR